MWWFYLDSQRPQRWSLWMVTMNILSKTEFNRSSSFTCWEWSTTTTRTVKFNSSSAPSECQWVVIVSWRRSPTCTGHWRPVSFVLGISRCVECFKPMTLSYPIDHWSLFCVPCSVWGNDYTSHTFSEYFRAQKPSSVWRSEWRQWLIEWIINYNRMDWSNVCLCAVRVIKAHPVNSDWVIGFGMEWGSVVVVVISSRNCRIKSPGDSLLGSKFMSLSTGTTIQWWLVLWEPRNTTITTMMAKRWWRRRSCDSYLVHK